MTTEIIYRQAVQEDMDLTYRIKTRSIKPYVTAIYGWDEDFQISFHQKTFSPDNTRILLLKEANGYTVFGYIEIEYRATGIFLANILIDEAFQGKGLGKAIVSQLMYEAGIRSIRLEVFRINKRARTFYERLGFRVIGRDKIKNIMEWASSNSPK